MVLSAFLPGIAAFFFFDTLYIYGYGAKKGGVVSV